MGTGERFKSKMDRLEQNRSEQRGAPTFYEIAVGQWFFWHDHLLLKTSLLTGEPGDGSIQHLTQDAEVGW